MPLFYLEEQHFSDVILSEEFLNLGVEQVCSLISSDKLTIASEEKVFEAVIAWVNHDKDVRQELMAHLMEHVRLPLLSREYLVQRVEEETLVKNSSACKDYLIEAMKYHLLPTEQRALMKSTRTRLRTPVSLPKYSDNSLMKDLTLGAPFLCARMLYAVGGYDGASRQCLSTVECYNSSTNEWTCVAEMSTRRSGAVDRSTAGYKCKTVPYSKTSLGFLISSYGVIYMERHIQCFYISN
ncbi:Kelch-like protein 2 [Platysternon megacephalum]|uniref:Kelch-like protein 2 n=1 Tax=Platysternon megacephalum TaxID=55544 RepID=A0A4D9FEK9_9SAUR|nr:Kelch-like protein 2 [Platysternon megacephalum]